jgi:predicted DNA-binding protein
MITLSFQAPAEIKEKLEYFAKEMDRSQSWLIRDALTEYLEDLADYVEARKVQATTRREDYIPFEEIEKMYGLNDE